MFQSFPQTSLAAATTGVETTYDGLGRVIQTRENVAPFATTRTLYYSVNRMRVTDPEGNITETRRSGYGSPDDGNPIWIISYPDGRSNSSTRIYTDMAYDIYGNLTRATRDGLSQRWRYDNRLRVCNSFTPETGGRRYQYDDAGQVIAYAEGHSQSCGDLSSTGRITNTYDDLGRITRIDYPRGTPDVTMTYDANGNVLTNRRGGANWTYTYDTNDQLTSETLAIDGRTYATQYTYDTNGHLVEQRTPGNRALRFDPDGFGRPRVVRTAGTALNFVNRGRYHANGTLRYLQYNNGFIYTSVLTERQLNRQIRTRRGSLDVINFGYSYDRNGRMTAQRDYADRSKDRTYTYDDTGRLKTATGQWGTASYQYDGLNNLLAKSISGRNVSLQYDSKNRLSAAQDSADGLFRPYTHDSRGNVIGDGTYVFIYDRANQPTAMSGGGTTGSFVYDGNYKRAKQIINGETIYTMYGRDGSVLYRDNATTGIATDYIRMGGKTIARIKSDGETAYLHQDHLGTPVAATDPAGNILWREAYTPFGESLNPPASNADQDGFTGHIRDTATGLTYMQTRYYDPVIGRFLSNDPVGFAQGGVDYFNRYSYTANDPVNNFDPDGRDTISVRFRDQQIRFGGFTIPQAISGGHSGSVIIRNDGSTRYREYGRYRALEGDVAGAVRSVRIPDIEFDGGVPTTESLTNVFESLLDIGESAGSDDLQLTINVDADDFDSMMNTVNEWDQSVEYSVRGQTCHDFCRAVETSGSSTGGSFSDRLISQRLTPDNVDTAVENVRQRYEDLNN